MAKVVLVFEDLPDGDGQVKVTATPSIDSIKKKVQEGGKSSPAEEMAAYCAFSALVFSPKLKKDRFSAKRALVTDLKDVF